MASGTPRFILVDTNCFIRLYQSPVLPLLGQDIGGFRLLTLAALADEFNNNPNLQKLYPWMVSGPKANDLKNAKLILSGINKRKVTSEQQAVRFYARALLVAHSNKQGISPPKSLSSRDVELLATTIVLEGVIATDEWPLALVANNLKEDPSYKIEVFDSIKVLHLLESNKKISAEARRNTVETWVRLREKLPRNWRITYEHLFGESADLLGTS